MTNDLENRFTYHAPQVYQINLYESIRSEAYAYARWLDDILPDGREKSLAITHLEEVVFWANAAIARNS